MRLTECHIESFGRLSDFNYIFSSGINDILEENGWGKSTFATFIKCMFYGFEGERKHDLSNERKRYMPWQGGVYGGRISFTENKKSYTLRRTFGANEKADTFSLIDSATGLESEDFSQNIGAELFGLDVESFKKTMFIGQEMREFDGATDDILAKLGDITDLTEAENNFDRMMERLDKKISTYNSRVNADSIPQIKNAITGLEVACKNKAVLENSREQNKVLLVEAREELEKCEKKIHSLQEERSKVLAIEAHAKAKLRVQEMEEKVQAILQRTRKIEEEFPGRVPTEQELSDAFLMCKELTTLEANKSAYALGKQEEEALYRFAYLYGDGMAEVNDAPYKKGIGDKICFALALLCLIAGGISFVLKLLPITIALGGCMALFAILGFVMHSLEKKSQERFVREKQKEKEDLKLYRSLLERQEEFTLSDREYQEKIGRLEHFFSSIGITHTVDYYTSLCELQKRLQRFKASEEEYALVKADFESLLKSEPASKDEEGEYPSLEEVDSNLRKMNQEAQRIHASLASYERRLAEISLELDDVAEKEENLSCLKEKLEESQKELKLFQKTQDILNEAKTSFSAKHMGPVTKEFLTLVSRLVKDEETYSLDAKMQVQSEELGQLRSLEMLSAGKKDLLGFCMRLALVKTMMKGKETLLIIDDAFVNLDDERIRDGIAFLEEMAKETQILYFTCHSSRKIQ